MKQPKLSVDKMATVIERARCRLCARYFGVAEYLSVLDDAAFGGATPVEPKLLSPTDPAARYTAAANTPAVYAYSDNYLIDLKKAVIMDVEATTTIRQAEVGAAKTMLDRTTEQFDITPSRLIADAGHGSADMIEWLVDERGIEPHVKLMDKSERTDGTFSRSDFAYDPDRNLYVCPGGKELRKYHPAFSKPRQELTKEGTLIYFVSKRDCEACALKPKCCPNGPQKSSAALPKLGPCFGRVFPFGDRIKAIRDDDGAFRRVVARSC